jgi:hypothetical protein
LLDSLNWTKSGSDAVLSGGNVIVNTTAAANGATVTVNGRVSSSVLGVYCGATAGLVTGNMGGYTGAKALCETACSNTNAHMCTAHELSISFQLGIPLPNVQLWYSTYVYASDIGLFTTDCFGWASSSSTPRGALRSTLSDNRPTDGDCSVSYQVACCL